VNRVHQLAVFATGLVAAGCLSSAGALPPVRWFDPLPATPQPSGDRGPLVTAASHLGREFAVRIAERELAFDLQHQWIAEPRELVAMSLAGMPPADRVHVTAFELDVTVAPQAVVRVVVTANAGQEPRVVTGTAPASDRSPAAFAAAMSQALAEVRKQLIAR